jgi:hypothetical protein
MQKVLLRKLESGDQVAHSGVSLVSMRLRITFIAIAALSLLLAIGADAALVRVGRIVVRADGGFTPTALPKHSYAPIRFRGYTDISSTDSAPPPALQSAWIDFDRDGRLTTKGLPTCPPARIDDTDPETARRTCGNALVGTGSLQALVTLPGVAPVTVQAPLSLFNGPRQGGNATVIAHAQATYPSLETHVIVVPIERRHGAFGYRASITVPEFAGGHGVLTHGDLNIGRRYRSSGSKRSYISARCRDGIFETRGRLTFDDGTVIDGTVYKGCSVRR